MSSKNNTPLVDRGWHNMSEMLDRELPQKKDKRRPLFILFLLIGLGISIGILVNSPFGEDAIYKQGQEKYSKVKQPVQIQETNSEVIKSIPESITNKIEEETDIIINQQLPIISESISTSKSDILGNNGPTAMSKKVVFDNNKATIKPGKRSEIQAEIKSRVEPTQFVDVSIFDKDVKALNEVEENRTSDATKLIENSIEINEPNNNSPIELNELPILWPINIISNNRQSINTNKELIVAEMITPAVESRFSVRPYVLGQGTYNQSLNGVGYGLGGGLLFKNDNFGLYVEAAYSRMNYTGYANQTFDVEVFDPLEVELSDENKTGEFEIVDNNGEVIGSFDFTYPDTRQLLGGLDFASLTIGVKKQVFNRFSLSGGISYARIFNKKTNQVILNPSIANNSTLFDLANMNERSFSIDNSISDHEWALNIGTEYALNERIAIGLNYRHGLTDIFNAEDGDRPAIADGEDKSSSTLLLKRIEGKVSYSF